LVMFKSPFIHLASLWKKLWSHLNLSICHAKDYNFWQWGVVAKWLRYLPLNQGIMNLSPTWVKTMFLHMTPAHLGPGSRLESDEYKSQEHFSQSSLNKYVLKLLILNICRHDAPSSQDTIHVHWGIA
jgi:hypothetical protein